jgi:hypothetical protein
VRAAFPDLDTSGLRQLGTGFGSTVVETGEGIVLRIGRTAAAARGHAIEAAVLADLAPMLPVAVPGPDDVWRAGAACGSHRSGAPPQAHQRREPAR